MVDFMKPNVHTRDERGFTLVEMLIVIVVLGILAGIAVIVAGNAREDSVASACKTDYKSIELSAEGVNSKTGTYPQEASGVQDSQAAANTKYADLLSGANKGGVLREYPFNDNYRLVYEQSSGGANFRIRVLDGAGTPLTGAGATEFTVGGCESL